MTKKKKLNNTTARIYEKLQTASDESYKDPTNLQAKIQKHQAFEAEASYLRFYVVVN